ncbi:MAG: hypothetical protein AB7D07_15430 [Desulfovibrionaceae bacterium]|jgi:hypothetical protein
MDRRRFINLMAAAVASSAGLLTACGKPTKYLVNPYVAKSMTPPPIKYCFTTVGHVPGTQPFIFGGTCCCTPTQELMDQYHADGFLLDMELEDLLAEYETRGIVLRHEGGWQCNNLCSSGPHLVFGGHCMVPPTIGTQNYENVITGKKPVV